MTFSMCALATSEGFPNFNFKITFALSYPSVVKGRPSIKTRALEANNSFKCENFEIRLNPTCQFEFYIGSRNGTSLDAYLLTDLLPALEALP